MFVKRRKQLVWLLTVVFLLTQALLAAPLFGQTTTGAAFGPAADKSSSTGTGRIAGEDRYQTAVAVSQKGWKTAEYAVLARGDNFADALCAGPLAQKYNGPILLTAPTVLNQDTLKELKRLGVKHLFITGGTGAVSQGVEDALKAGGIATIERIYGNDRYDTSVKIAEKLGAGGKAVLATGSDFPDALSISVVAAKLGMPILLTAKDNVPGVVNRYFQNKAVTQTYLIGGTGVISSNIEKAVPGALRLSGNDRYETNKAVLQNFEKEFRFENIYVAIGGGPQGNEFADALTGAVLAAKNSSPLVLTGKTLPQGTADYLKGKLVLSSKATGLGGKAVVPSSVLAGIIAYKEQIPVAQKYSIAGTYGPETGKETISGSVTISVPDVTLRNTVIEGDLLLAQSIGDGNVYLKDVTVKGKTIINGGGPNSVIMYNFNGQTVVVDVPDGSSVRLVAQGSTSVNNISMEGNGTLQESELTGAGFINVEIPAGAEVTLSGSFDQVNVEAAGANINVASGTITTMTISETAQGAGVNLAGGTSVSTLNANAPSNITGQGQITTANVNTNNVTIEQTPGNTNVAGGVTTNVGGQQQSGNTPSYTGGSDSPSPVPINSVTVTNATTVEVTMVSITGVTFTWNGTAPTNVAAHDGSKYVLTVPATSMKLKNTLVASAGGYNNGFLTYNVTGTINNLKVIGADTAALRSAITAAVDGDTILMAEGTYELDSVVALTEKQINLIGAGKTSTLVKYNGASQNGGLFSTPVNSGKNGNIIFKSIGFSNIRSGVTQGNYVFLSNCGTNANEVYFDDCSFDNFYTVAYFNNTHSGQVNNNRITISNCVIDNTAWVYSQDDITPGSRPLTNFTISNNTGNSANKGKEDFGGITVRDTATLQSKSRHTTLQAAVTGAAGGDTIVLAAGTFLSSSQISINKALIVVGAGADKTFLKVSTDLGNVNGSKHALTCYNQPVTIKNLTIDSDSKAFGVNTYNEAQVTYENITLKNSKGAGLTVNGSSVTATNLITNNNSWGAVNVDPGSGVTKPSVFTLLSGSLSEAKQIWSDGRYVTAQATVTVNANGYTKYHIAGGTNIEWTNLPLTNAATITKGGITTKYSTIQAAADAAAAADTVDIAVGTYDLTAPLNINKAITVQGVNRETVILKGAVTIANTVSISNGATLKSVTVTRDNSVWSGNSNMSLVAFGQNLSAETTLDNCIVKHGRNGVYLNNTANAVIKNNFIDNNRTGIQMANSVSASVQNNTITNNHTEGVLLQYLSADNFGIPTFTGNTIKDNWYSDFENRWPVRSPQYQVNLTGNTFTDLTSRIADNSGEPGYDALQPVELGGSAVRPATRVTFVMKTPGNLILPLVLHL